MISVILNSYNLGLYLKEAIESLIAQDYSDDFEIVVIDDASTDNSQEIISSFKDDRIKPIFLIQNNGARNAVEKGLEISSGKYICRFDADDKWPTNFLSRSIEVLESYHEVDMVYGDFWPIDERSYCSEPNGVSVREFLNSNILENEFIHTLKKYYINAPTIMFRRNAFEKAFPLPSCLTNFIDWYISLKVLETGKAFYINKPIAYYRIHDKNMHRQQISSRMGEEVTKYIMEVFVRENSEISTFQINDIISENYFQLAENYFSVKMFKDAKRLYLESLYVDFAISVRQDLVKHLFGSVFPGFYQAVKSMLN